MLSNCPEWLTRILDVLFDRGIASTGNVEGCSESEINEISNIQILPLRYREFLTVMGRSAGALFVGTDIFYQSIVGLTEDALRGSDKTPNWGLKIKVFTPDLNIHVSVQLSGFVRASKTHFGGFFRHFFLQECASICYASRL